MTENKATQERTPQERLQEEQEHKEHVHHTKINAAAIADHRRGDAAVQPAGDAAVSMHR